MSETNFYTFPCGCSFPIDDAKPLINGLPSIIYRVEDVPLTCPATWELISSGRTKGVFQLESSLGKAWSKRLKPENIEQLAALVSLLRPGCISGDAHIVVGLYQQDIRNAVRKVALRDLFHKFHRNHRLFRPYIISLNEETGEFFQNIIEDIVYSGEKEVYRPNFDSYSTYDVDATLDHEFLVKDKGWIRLDALAEGDLVAVLRYTKQREVDWVKYIDYDPMGVKDTYDISVAKPHHNFIADNVVVHNCLKAKDERGVSMTELYCRRKNGEEEFEIDVKAVRSILEETYDIVVFQEQFMQMSQIVSGFNLTEVDALRKASAKKSQEAMTKVGELFIEKADKLGVITKEEAERLFANIRKSAKYSFNKCISFDTKMLRQKGRQGSQEPYTVEEMYRIRNDISYAKATNHLSLYKKWKMLGNYGKGLSLCEDGRIRPNTIVDIQPAGIQTVYKITLENGATIRTTRNHKFPTSEGEMTVEEMHMFNGLVSLLTCGPYEQCTKKYNWSNFTNEDRAKKIGQSGQDTHGENNRWFTNGSYTKFREFQLATPDNCFDCGRYHKRIETHHINGDRSNSAAENLVKLCPSCHKKREYAVGRTKRGEKGYPVIPVKIKSIRVHEKCMTYDITMAAPNHTFVVDSGIVTCNSHAISYAVDCFWTAHQKAHFPLYFFTAYLYFAKEKQKPLEEIRALINEAKLFNIEVLPPKFSTLEKHFATDGVEITFGLSDVKGVGEKTVDKVLRTLPSVEQEVGRSHTIWSWFEFLIYFSEHVDATAVKKMIEVGAMRNFGASRLRLLAEYTAWRNLSDRERETIAELHLDITETVDEKNLEKRMSQLPALCEVDYDSYDDGKLRIIIDRAKNPKNLEESIGHLLSRVLGYTKTKPFKPRLAVTTARREKVRSILHDLQNPASPLEDRPYWIAKKEEEALGMALTCTHLDSADTSKVNTTCKELREGKNRPHMTIGVEIQEFREFKVKNGPSAGSNMAYLVVADATGLLDDVVVFSDAWEKFGNMLMREKTVVALQGNRDKNRGSFIVEKVMEI